MKKLLLSILCAAICLSILSSCGTPDTASGSSSVSSGPVGNTGSESTDSWPKKRIEIIIPYSAGGDSDTFLRAAANSLSKELGVNVIVSNVTGGGTQGALASVLNADADGYTILYYNYTNLNQEANGSM